MAEGYLQGRVGAGTFVTAAAVPEQQKRHQSRPGGALRPRVGWVFVPDPTSSRDDSPRADFRVGIPDPALFPFDTWRRLVSAELRLRANLPGTYGEPSGHPALREAIAGQLGRSRSLRAVADDILITNGTQQALDLTARVLLAPGDVVAVEEPGYSRARALLASRGATVVGVPVDPEGIVVQRIPAGARLVFCTPSHQFPLGFVMSLARRRELLRWADDHDAAIFEDDYDSEFRFTPRPLAPLHSLDREGRVLYAGTFSNARVRCPAPGCGSTVGRGDEGCADVRHRPGGAGRSLRRSARSAGPGAGLRHGAAAVDRFGTGRSRPTGAPIPDAGGPPVDQGGGGDAQCPQHVRTRQPEHRRHADEREDRARRPEPRGSSRIAEAVPIT